MSESRVHHVLLPSDERNLSPHELRIPVGRAFLHAVLLFVVAYAFLTWLIFFPLNRGMLATYVVPMGALLLYPVAVIEHLFQQPLPFLSLIKVLLVVGPSLWLARMGFVGQWQIQDGYKHVAGRRYLRNPLQSERLLIHELDRMNPDFTQHPEKLGMVIDGKFRLSNALLGGHMVIPGPPGSGKTAFLARLLKEIVEDPHAFLVVHDNKGDMTSMLPLELCEILAPWDKRATPLLIGKDIDNKVLATEFAAATIPEDKNNKFFTDAARQIREGLILKLQQEKPERWSFADLLALELLPCIEMKQVIDAFNPIAGHYLSDPESKMTVSILSTLASSARTIQQLAEAYAGQKDGKKGFSVRRWMMSIAMAGKQMKSSSGKTKRIKAPAKRILILQSNANYSQLSQGYIRTVLSIMSNTMNSPEFTENPDRKIYLLLDEFPQLGRLESFKPFLETGRSKGIKVMLAFQSYNQLYELYGDRDGKAILDNANHSIYLGGNSKESVKEICDLLGKRTVFHRKWSSNQNAQGVSYNLTDATEQVPIILESEIQADFGARKDGVYALVNLARTDYVFRIRFPYLDHQWESNPPMILADWVSKSGRHSIQSATRATGGSAQSSMHTSSAPLEQKSTVVKSVSTLAVANGHHEVLEMPAEEMMEATAEIAFDLISHDAAALCHALDYVDEILTTPLNDNVTVMGDETDEDVSSAPILRKEQQDRTRGIT